MLAAEFRTLADLPPELTGPLFARVRQVSATMATALGDADGSFIAVNNTVTQSVPTCTSTSYRARTGMDCAGPPRCWPTPAGTCSGRTPGMPTLPSKPDTRGGSAMLPGDRSPADSNPGILQPDT